MSWLHFPERSGAWIAIALTTLGLMVLAAGCTSYNDLVPSTPVPEAAGGTPSMTPATPAPSGTSGQTDVAVSVEKIDDSTIVITYLGGPGAGRLMEIRTTITDDRGSVSTQTLGSRLETTPVQRGGTSTFHGQFKSLTHVITVGTFADGSFQGLFDGLV
jgi:hypothetical protein